MFWMTLAFALAVSMDGFGVALTYGIRKIHIPFISMLIISSVSASMVGISMGSGKLIATLISPTASSILSAVLLMSLGFWIIFKAWIETKKNKITEEMPVFKWQIPSLGIAVQILCEPDLADADASGSISAWEAFYLGVALALDALGAGLAMAMAGYSVVLSMLLVGLCKIFMLSTGLYLGLAGTKEKITGKLAFIPGMILLLLGIWKIY